MDGTELPPFKITATRAWIESIGMQDYRSDRRSRVGSWYLKPADYSAEIPSECFRR